MQYRSVVLFLQPDFSLLQILLFDTLPSIGVLAAGFLAVLLIIFTLLYFARKIDEKEELRIREKVLPEIASKFGKLISTSDHGMRFEYDQAVFDAGYKKVTKTTSVGIVTEIVYEVKFSLLNLPEKFFIQHDALLFSTFPTDCRKVSLPEMPKDLIFHSLNPEFLLSILKKEKIFNEIAEYPKDWTNRFRISFENATFELTWITAGERARNVAESLFRVCRTAVTFYDELSKR